MKKIVFIVGNPHTFYGFFKGQLKYLSNDFEVSGISSSGDWQNTTKLKEGITVYTVNIKREISPFKDLKSLFALIKLLYHIKPDAVHANTPKVGLISMIGSYIVGIKCRIYMCHGLRYQSTSGMMRLFLKNMERISCILSTHVVSVSKSVKECLIKDNIAPSKKINIIRNGSVNGIDDDYLEYSLPFNVESNLLKDLNISNDSFIFSFVGRIVKDKGINELINVFNKICIQYNNIHLLIIGDFDNSFGSYEEKHIKELITKNKNIHVLGWKDDVRPFIALSDVMVQPSYREGLSTTLLEASSLKIPAITTQATGCKDVILNGINGILISSPLEVSSDVFENELFLAMEKYLLSSKEYLHEVGEQGNKLIKANFYRKDIWEESLSFYKSII